jgi:hypothetical protein
MTKTRILVTASLGALSAALLLAPSASAASPPDTCPGGDMCVYSQAGFGGNEISSPPSIPIDVPGNFGGVHSFYNNSSVRWCGHISIATGGGEYQIDPDVGLGTTFNDIQRFAVDGSC